MTRIFTDGAEFQDLLFWDYNTGSAIETTIKRSGDASYIVSSNTMKKNLVQYLSEFYVRFGWRVAVFSNPETLQWVRSGTTLGRVRANISQQLELYVGGTKVATSSDSFLVNTWHLIEVYVKIHDTEGILTLRVDGKEQASYPGDTRPTTATDIDQLIWGSWGGSTYIDDLALNDTNGSVDNSWCGDGHVILLKPNANGDVTQLYGSDGNQTDNYLLVDDAPHDTDTTYVVASGVDTYDLYNLASPVPASGISIMRVWAEGRIRKTVADATQIAFRLKTNSTEYTEVDKDLLTSYTAIVGSGYRTNPQTGVEWTIEELDALQVGVVYRD